MTGLHHVEIWLHDFAASIKPWEWLLTSLGFEKASTWDGGVSFAAQGTYLTFTTSPNLQSEVHNRRQVGLNHLAFKAGSCKNVDAIMKDAVQHGWQPLYQERYPFAGGENHYAGWLENADGFKAEIVAENFLQNPGE